MSVSIASLPEQSHHHFDAILQAADEIHSEDPNVPIILCEQAYSMAQNLDPNSDGRGVVQFKTGLMSVIKCLDPVPIQWPKFFQSELC